jgi:hypothetical protein
MNNNNLEIFELPQNQFTVSELQRIHTECLKTQHKMIVDNGGDISVGIINRSMKPLKLYIDLYYYEIEKGNYMYYDVFTKEFKYKEKKDFINEVIMKLDESLYKNIFQKNHKIFTIVSKIDKPILYNIGDHYFLNECRGFLHIGYKPFETYSDELKSKLQIMLDYIKEVSCGNDETFFNCYLKYLAQVCRGIRTEVIIYKKTMQGCGKSTESDFIIEYVLGTAVSVNSGTEPLLTPYNKSLLGKIYVVFEELPVFSSAQWSGVSSMAKKIATNPRLDYRTLYESPINAENNANLIINTNCESIKDSNGRRIVIMPVNNSRMNDYKYFGYLRDNCFNLEVGEIFYSYLMSLDVKGFYAQKEFPETSAKRIAISELLPPHMKFLKYEYYLKSKEIKKVSPSDLFKEYSFYCNLNGIKHPLTKNNFYKELKADLAIEPYKTAGYMKYDVTLETLKDLATRFKWICQYDEFEEEEEEEKDEDDFIDDPLEGKQPNIAYYEKEIKRLKALLENRK